MQKIISSLTLELALAGVTPAAVEFIPGEGGGVVVRVSRLADTFAAEPVAAKFTRDFGVEVLVAF